MKQKFLYMAVLIAAVFISPLFSAGMEDIQTKKLTQDRLTLFPVPKDNLNYLFLQSISAHSVH